MKEGAYVVIANEAIKRELPHDKFIDYVLIHNVPKDTDRGRVIEQEIKYKLRKNGYRAKVSWIDEWTMKVEVL